MKLQNLFKCLMGLVAGTVSASAQSNLNNENTGMKTVGGIVFPDDNFSLVKTTYDGLPAVVVVNSGLREFQARAIFGWSCSVIIEYQELAENGMPTKKESELVLKFFEKLDAAIKGDPEQPNALFLARVTNNGQLQAIWQVNNPELVNEYLQQIIADKKYPREFDYRMEYDAEWSNVSWFLQDFK